MTVKEFLTGWVNAKYGEDQLSTKRFYANAIINHIIPTLGNIKASKLTSKAIEQLLRDMAAQNYGAGTIKAVRAALSAAYSDAKRLGDLVRNPVENVKCQMFSLYLLHIYRDQIGRKSTLLLCPTLICMRGLR